MFYTDSRNVKKIIKKDILTDKVMNIFEGTYRLKQFMKYVVNKIDIKYKISINKHTHAVKKTDECKTNESFILAIFGNRFSLLEP